MTTILESFAWWLSGRDQVEDHPWGDYNPPMDFRTEWHYTEEAAIMSWAERNGYDLNRDDKCPPFPSKPWTFILTCHEWVSSWVTSTFHPLFADYCNKFGHADLVDNGSYFGPEGAGDAFTCPRCHECWGHTYF